MLQEAWAAQASVRWVGLLLASHHRWSGTHLLAPWGGAPSSALGAAAAVWHAPLVVLSHRLGDDPVLVYGNRAALALWERTWEEFTALPSRLTAEPDLRAERAAALAEVAATGISHGYGGVRVTATGRRFAIAGATLWNVLDDDGTPVGQAAAFSPRVRWLPAAGGAPGPR